MSDCEKVSVCCGEPDLWGDESGVCGDCREHTSFECAIHHKEWADCNIREANRVLALAGLRHANMQDALATAYAKSTHRSKESVLEELRDLERKIKR